MQVQSSKLPASIARWRLPTKTQQPKPETSSSDNERSSIASTIGDHLLHLGYTISSLPKFIYPTVVGTPKQQSLIWEALEQLPMHQAVRPISIAVDSSFKQGPNLLGFNRVAIGSIRINAGGYIMQNADHFKYTVTHEVGHSNDYQSGLFSLLSRQHPSAHRPFGEPGFVSDYAQTQPAEDFAESFAQHHTDPDFLQASSPAKADVLQQMDKPGFLEKLVDQPAYRETGKTIAQSFYKLPAARTVLEFGRQVSIASLALTGSAESVEGIVKGQWTRAARGLLNSAAGISLAMAPSSPWMGVIATAALGATRGLQLAEAQNATAAQKVVASSAAAVGGTLGGFLAPLALVQAGYSLAGPVGGAVGLVVGGLCGTYYGSQLSAKAALSLTQAE